MANLTWFDQEARTDLWFDVEALGDTFFDVEILEEVGGSPPPTPVRQFLMTGVGI